MAAHSSWVKVVTAGFTKARVVMMASLTRGFHRTRYGNVTAAARLGRDFALLAFPPGALRQRNAALRASRIPARSRDNPKPNVLTFHSQNYCN